MDEENEPLTKAFTVRLSERLYGALHTLAHRDRRRFADYVRIALEDHVAREQKQGQRDEP